MSDWRDRSACRLSMPQAVHDATDLIAKGLAGKSPMLIKVAIAREFK